MMPMIGSDYHIWLLLYDADDRVQLSYLVVVVVRDVDDRVRLSYLVAAVVV
jgi:hypothetical protein